MEHGQNSTELEQFFGFSQDGDLSLFDVDSTIQTSAV